VLSGENGLTTYRQDRANEGEMSRAQAAELVKSLLW
jgi:hypothetical protein